MSDLDAAPSRRETIEAAFDAVTEEADAPAVAAAPEPSTTEDATATESGDASTAAPEPVKAKSVTPTARGEGGKFQKAEPSKSGKAGVVPPAPTILPQAAALKPPQSWKPAAREKWGALPKEVQEEAVRHDKEVHKVMQESAEARKNWGAFQAAVAPYEGMIRAEGGDPIRSAVNLYQTAMALRTAPAQHKAGIVRDIIRTFGVDIDMLSAALSGQPAPQQQAQAAHFQDPRVDQLLSRLQQAEQSRSQSVAEQGNQAVSEFSQNAEFYEDVRHDMADLMELATKRNVALTLEQAYNRAVANHPEVSQVMEQREAAKRANALQASTQRSRAASSSLRSQPGGAVNGTPQPVGRRAMIEAAFDEHGL